MVLLSGHDINYYLTDRPPTWYVALGVGAVLAAVFLTILAFLYVCAIFVMPILLFEDCRVTEAVQESRARTGGARLRIGTLVLGWQFLGTILSVMLVWGFGRGCSFLLASAESRPLVLVPMVAGLLTCHASLAGCAFVRACGDPMPADPSASPRAWGHNRIDRRAGISEGHLLDQFRTTAVRLVEARWRSGMPGLRGDQFALAFPTGSGVTSTSWSSPIGATRASPLRTA